jgi:NAD(P)-dependent dehydrogenase (short-subunit alcohol dehydrogenase family)
LDELGVRSIAGLVNVAAAHGDAVPLEAVRRADLDEQFAIVTGSSMLTATLLPLLRAGGGRIVNVGAGALAMPLLGTTFAAKHALEAISNVLRVELAATGVAVIVVEPGMTRWEDVTAQRAAYEDALARGVARVAAADELRYALTADTLKRHNRRRLDRGATAVQVAATIERALTDRRPRPRYYCGTDSRLAALLARALPTSLTDRMLRRTLRL